VKPAATRRDQTSCSPANCCSTALGRALQVFEPIGRASMPATPCRWSCARPKAFVLWRTAAARLPRCGVGVVLPQPSAVAWPAGWACRFEASCRRNHGAFSPRRNPGVALGPDDRRRHLHPQDLERLREQSAAHWCSTRAWIELASGRLRNAEKFCPRPPARLDRPPWRPEPQRKAKPWQRLPVHRFTAGPGARGAGAVPPTEGSDPLPAPAAFLRPAAPRIRSGAGLAGLPAPLRHMAPALADDMGLGNDDPSCWLPAANLKSRAGTEATGACWWPPPPCSPN